MGSFDHKVDQISLLRQERNLLVEKASAITQSQIKRAKSVLDYLQDKFNSGVECITQKDLDSVQVGQSIGNPEEGEPLSFRIGSPSDSIIRYHTTIPPGGVFLMHFHDIKENVTMIKGECQAKIEDGEIYSLALHKCYNHPAKEKHYYYSEKGCELIVDFIKA